MDIIIFVIYHTTRYAKYPNIIFLTKVGRLEVTDEEWQAEMLEDFETSGLIHSRGKRGILTKVPKGI